MADPAWMPPHRGPLLRTTCPSRARARRRHARRRRQRLRRPDQAAAVRYARIDLLAGPVPVAAGLPGQAEHGPDSPAALVTTSEDLARPVLAEAERQLAELKMQDIARPAWTDHGSIIVADSRGGVMEPMDDLAPGHPEVTTTDDDCYMDSLTNYRSVFIGPRSTVAYSDKGMAGTNQVLPTAGGAGQSVSRFVKPLTYQRVSKNATPLLADAVDISAEYEGMAAHRATATPRTGLLL